MIKGREHRMFLHLFVNIVKKIKGLSENVIYSQYIVYYTENYNNILYICSHFPTVPNQASNSAKMAQACASERGTYEKETDRNQTDTAGTRSRAWRARPWAFCSADLFLSWSFWLCIRLSQRV